MPKKPPPREYFVHAGWGSIEYARDSSGCLRAKEFFESLPEEMENVDDGKKAKVKLEALFTRMATNGKISNKTKFSKEDGPIYGFKLNFKNKLIRFACFQDGRAWVLTHGFFKQGAQKGKGKWLPSQITTAKTIMADHLLRYSTPEKKNGKA